MVTVNSVDLLQDLYVNKNAQATKHWSGAVPWSKLMPQSIIFQKTEDPAYVEKRKALSGAFFKSKLLGMTRIIKQVTLKEIAELQQGGDREVDIAKVTLSLQSRIIVTVSVGEGYSQKMIDFENQDGSFVKLGLSEYLDRLITFTIGRCFLFVNLLVRELTPYALQSSDRLYCRNVMRFRQVIQEMINDRRQSKSQSVLVNQPDLLSILLTTDFYQGQDEVVIDEIISFFLAGMKTIQISTTNLVYYLTKHPEIKDKLLKEILPVVKSCEGNLVEDLTYDKVMEFDYFQMCFNEVLRIEPPASFSQSQQFT